MASVIFFLNFRQVLVAEKSEFPLLRERGITLQPGEEHFLEVSGVAVSARYVALYSPLLTLAQHRRRRCCA